MFVLSARQVAWEIHYITLPFTEWDVFIYIDCIALIVLICDVCLCIGSNNINASSDWLSWVNINFSANHWISTIVLFNIIGTLSLSQQLNTCITRYESLPLCDWHKAELDHLATSSTYWCSLWKDNKDHSGYGRKRLALGCSKPGPKSSRSLRNYLHKPIFARMEMKQLRLSYLNVCDNADGLTTRVKLNTQHTNHFDLHSRYRVHRALITLFALPSVWAKKTNKFLKPSRPLE